ncbi:MAG: 5-nucleotidase / UDP-sugar diphosphatase [Blastocatellia bacterium]|nr:5-nucleotidase / UDP-sugar diphosphatase [Blastocatellia bacterium]
MIHCERALRRRWSQAIVLMLVLCAACMAQATPDECNVRLTILQVNDVYQFAPVDRGARGGLARVSTLRKKILQESPHTLLLMSGDTISPSVESITYKGQQMIDAWNNIGLDYATFGNHEFDFGPDVLQQRVKESNFKWLAANVVDKKSGKTFAQTQPFIIREFAGAKVGIFGITLPETKNTSRPGPDVDFLDPCATARQLVPQIRAQGAQVVIALTHLSMREDKELARCADVDLIIGGHEHTLLESMAGHAPIFKMTSDARELGRIDLNISQTTGKLESIDWKVIPVTGEVQEDPQFAEIYRKYGGLLAELNERVGHTDVELDAKSEASRSRETNVGDFIADAYRKAVGADVSLFNGGSIRADSLIARGDLTKRDVLSILPFKNRVVKLEVTGATLRAALEHGVSRSAEDKEPGRFPQVSGLRFSFDASRAAGSRVTSVTINGQPLDDKKMYTLAAPTFIAKDGGDGYAMFQGAQFLVQPDAGPIDSDILRAAIAAVKTIAPQTDGRIQRQDKPANEKAKCDNSAKPK